MYCPACFRDNAEDAVHCTACGAALLPPMPSARAAVGAIAPAPAPTAPAVPAPQQKREEKRDAPAVVPEPRQDRDAERRAHERLAAHVNMVLRYLDANGRPTEEEQTIADNIGRGGARVMTGRRLRKGSIVELTELGGDFQTRAVVRGNWEGREGIPRLNLQFLDRPAPSRLSGSDAPWSPPALPSDEAAPADVGAAPARTPPAEAPPARTAPIGAPAAAAREPAEEEAARPEPASETAPAEAVRAEAAAGPAHVEAAPPEPVPPVSPAVGAGASEPPSATAPAAEPASAPPTPPPEPEPAKPAEAAPTRAGAERRPEAESPGHEPPRPPPREEEAPAPAAESAPVARQPAGATASSPPPAPRELDAETAALKEEVEHLHQGLKSRSFYELLGVPRSAVLKQITSAYARLARRYHPDRIAQVGLPELKEPANAIFLRLGEARETLCDSEERAWYDRKLASGNLTPPTGTPQALEARPSGMALGWNATNELIAEGRQLLKTEKYWDAIQKMEAALPLVPDQHQRLAMQVIMARATVKNPKWVKRGEEMLRKVVSEDPKNVDALLALGQIYRDGGLRVRATRMYSRVLEVERRNEEARAALAELEAQR